MYMLRKKCLEIMQQLDMIGLEGRVRVFEGHHGFDLLVEAYYQLVLRVQVTGLEGSLHFTDPMRVVLFSILLLWGLFFPFFILGIRA